MCRSLPLPRRDPDGNRHDRERLRTRTGGALRGTGDTKYVMMLQGAVELFLRLPLIFLMAYLSESVYLLWLTMPLDLGLTAILFVRRWRSNRWRAIRLDA